MRKIKPSTAPIYSKSIKPRRLNPLRSFQPTHHHQSDQIPFSKVKGGARGGTTYSYSSPLVKRGGGGGGQKKIRPFTTTGFSSFSGGGSGSGSGSDSLFFENFKTNKKEQSLSPFLSDDYIKTKFIPSERNDTVDFEMSDTKKDTILLTFEKIYKKFNINYENNNNNNNSEDSDSEDSELTESGKMIHYNDLFQICIFFINEIKCLELRIEDVKQNNKLFEQEITDLKRDGCRSDIEIVLKAPSKEEVKKLNISIDKITKEILNFQKQSVGLKLNDNIHPSSSSNSLKGKESELFTNDDEDKEIEKKKQKKKTDNGLQIEDDYEKEEMENYKEEEMFLFYLKKKFRLLETFVMYLKKKIYTLEQSDDDLKQIFNEFETVKDLIQKNRDLDKLNKMYTWVKNTSNSDLLLNKKLLKYDNLSFLKSIIFLLQNELYFSLESLKKFLYYHSPSSVIKYPIDYSQFWKNNYSNLKLLVKGCNEIEDNEMLEKIKKESLIGKPSELESEEKGFKNELLRKEIHLRGLEDENKLLNERLERQRDEVNEYKKSLKILQAQMKKTTGKFQLKELDSSIRRQLDQIYNLSTKIEERGIFYVFQEKFIQKLKKEKELLEKSNLKINKKIDEINGETENIKKKITHQNGGIKVVNNVITDLSKKFFEEESCKEIFAGNKLNHKSYVSFMYSDMYENSIKTDSAAVKLQSWWRGVKTRKVVSKLNKGEKGKKFRIDESKYIVKRIKSRKIDEPEEISKKKPFMSIGQGQSTDTSLLIQKSNIISETNFKKVNSVQTVLKIIKTQISENIKKYSLISMNNTKKDLEKFSKQILKRVVEKEQRKTEQKDVQTENPKIVDVHIQAGVTQIENVVIKKKFN